jgi:hypothetical protein
MLNSLISEKISKLNKKVTRVLIIRNGANGISVFIPISFRDNNINNTLTIVPIQKDIIIAKIPDDKPSNHPIPRISFPSPRPISLPFEKNQTRTNGVASSGPAIKAEKVGKTKTEPEANKFTNMEKKETIIKTKTSLSGIILWRKS